MTTSKAGKVSSGSFPAASKIKTGRVAGRAGSTASEQLLTC